MTTLANDSQFILGKYQAEFEAALARLMSERVAKRIFESDFTLWKPEPDEITNRLGWLELPITMPDQLDEIKRFVVDLHERGFRKVLLLGMGGSSLAPELFAEAVDRSSDNLQLTVLDSTDPAEILKAQQSHVLSETLYLVSSKSGGTIETLSLLKYFYNAVSDDVGSAVAGSHFAAITDPGSRPVSIADKYSFNKCFTNDPNLGGRYSALSHFGLVPAALAGIDIEQLISSASKMREMCVDSAGGFELGVALGALALGGRNKLTFVGSPAQSHFANWLEQLIAESTGKDGMGILPVVDEPMADPEIYRDDRVFIWLKDKANEDHTGWIAKLVEQGHPIIELDVGESSQLGAELYRWEFATAVACHVLGVNPFDQPNVESTKARTHELISNLQHGDSGESYQELAQDSLNAAELIDVASQSDYVAIQAFISQNAEFAEVVRDLRTQILKRTGVATTFCYGPRYLHSTGQLHKGDAGNGFFLQLSCDDTNDLPIPDELGKRDSSLTFGMLKRAQAVGDLLALRDAGRHVRQVNLGDEPILALKELLDALN